MMHNEDLNALAHVTTNPLPPTSLGGNCMSLSTLERGTIDSALFSPAQAGM